MEVQMPTMRPMKRLTALSRGARLRLLGALATVGALAVVALPGGPVAGATTPTNVYDQANLVSDIPGVARITDPNLVNPWGMSGGPTTPLWISDNGTNVSTLYTGGVGGTIPAIVPLVVSIPDGAPTGTVFNPTNDFVVHATGTSAPARFIFVSESGTLSAWSPTVVSATTQAQVEFSSPDAVYKGLAIATTAHGTRLYAANFHEGRIDVFNSRFAPVKRSRGFIDPGIPAGFAPFDVQELGGSLYVTYAMQDAAKHDDVAGPGNGFVDVYDTSGHLLRRLISQGNLNSPWGLALAPSGFGAFSNDLLVGNFGDGAIHAYDPNTGALEGQLTNADGNAIAIDGLWGLRFGNGVTGTPTTLLFTAGIAAEAHGLFGEITLHS
jgi:uncharacterized protein (TIGR03118 family)